MRAAPTIGIIGHVGNGNLGDEALVAAVIQNVRQRFPNAEIRAFTVKPEDTAARHSIAAYPLRRGSDASSAERPVESRGPSAAARSRPEPAGPFARVRGAMRRIPLVGAAIRHLRDGALGLSQLPAELRFLASSRTALRGVDLVVVAGSQQLNDFVQGPWAFPYTLFKWAILARSTGAKFAFLSVGAGPIRAPLSRFFARHALRRAVYRSFRDETSRRTIRELGITGEHEVVPDLVFGMRLRDESASSGVTTERRPVVGVNPLPYCHPEHWHDRDPAAYEEYVRRMAEFADWLVARGYDVEFFSTQMRVDPPAIADIRRAMRTPAADDGAERVRERAIREFGDLAAAISDTDLVVATRYHGILLALLHGRPVLGLSYQQKSSDLLHLLGLGRFSVDLGSASTERLCAGFEALELAQADVRLTLARRLPELRAELDAQYERLFATLEASPGGAVLAGPVALADAGAQRA